MEQFDDQEQLSSVRSKINNNFTELENRSIGDLSDVDVSNTPPTQDDILVWDGSVWAPAQQGGGSLPQMYLNDLTDVDLASTLPTDGQTIVWDDAVSTWVPGDSAGSFVDLTDTPATLDAGSYLRVNSDGDAIEQIKTAPPDGGLGDQSAIQAASNFDSKLPDKLILEHNPTSNEYNGGPLVFELRQVSATKIIYCDTFGDDGASLGYRVTFNNNQFGDGWTTYGSHIRSPIDDVASPTLQQLIDANSVVYYGQKSGTSGAGSLSVMKAVSNFYTELPDAIVHQHAGNEHVLRLMHVETDYICYRMEDFGDSGTSPPDRRIYFANSEDGLADASLTLFFTAAGSLRHYIENGRALYYGSQPSTSSIGQLQEVMDNVPLASSVELPNAILDYDSGSSTVSRILHFEKVYNSDHFQYKSTADSNRYIRFDDTTGSRTSKGSSSNGDFGSIQEYISNGRALYYGGTSNVSSGGASSVEQLTDVDVTTAAPTDGQVLVYDDTDSKWKPGDQSSDFVDLTDTPATLDAGSYLRVNSTGDGVEQVKTAPPDGGVGDNSVIQAESNFDGKIPDQIVISSVTPSPNIAYFHRIEGGKIMYQMWTDGVGSSSFYLVFDNDATGKNPTFQGDTSYYRMYSGDTSLQKVIDNGRAIYHGQKSGTSGIGANSWLRQEYSTPYGSNNVYNRFYTDIPDCILLRDGDGVGGYWTLPLTISEIGYNNMPPANPDRLEIYYRYGNYYIRFDLNTTDGDLYNHVSIDISEAFGTGPQTLRSIIESGRALYYNSKSADNIQTGTYIGDGTTTQEVHLGFRPKMVTVKGVSTSDAEATYSGTNYFYDQTVFDTLTESGDIISRPYRNTSGYIVGHVGGERVPIEITDTGFKIIGSNTSTPVNDSAPNMAGAKYHYFAIGKDVTFSEGGGSSYTDADVSTYLNGNLDTHIIPDTNATYDIGSAEKKIRHLFLSDNSLRFVGADDVEHPLSVSDNQLKFDDKPVPHKFTDLPDVPDTLSTGDYLRVNSTGDAIESVKTAPPDGGRGGNGLIQAKSKFDGKLPDCIIVNSGDYTMPLVLRSVYDGDAAGSIEYMDPYGGGNSYIAFNNNPTGDGLRAVVGSFVIPNGRTSLQAMIDDGNVVYHGQKPGTSGVGNLSHVKTLANSSANGGFYTELPDAIVAESTSDTYQGVFRLHWVKPNSTAGGTNWEVIYRVEAFDGGSNNWGTDYHIGFLLDENGTRVSGSGATHTNSTTKNLRWYVENGRALYLGGQQDYGVKAWGKFDGTVSGSLSFTGGNIQSITRVSTGLYKVTFINPAPHADYSVSGSANPNNYGGASFGVREDFNPVTATDFHIEVRDQNNDVSNSNRISFQVVY